MDLHRLLVLFSAAVLCIHQVSSQTFLYTQLDGETNRGYTSSSFPESDDGAYALMGDDFNVPPGVTWTVTELRVFGFRNTALIPFNWTTTLYLDNGEAYNGSPGLPGYVLYTTNVNPSNGLDSENPRIVFPEPQLFQPGHYWWTISASMPTNGTDPFYVRVRNISGPGQNGLAGAYKASERYQPQLFNKWILMSQFTDTGSEVEFVFLLIGTQEPISTSSSSSSSSPSSSSSSSSSESSSTDSSTGLTATGTTVSGTTTATVTSTATGTTNGNLSGDSTDGGGGSSAVAAVVGVLGALAFVVILVIVALMAILFLKRRKNAAQHPNSYVEPNLAQQMTHIPPRASGTNTPTAAYDTIPMPSDGFSAVVASGSPQSSLSVTADFEIEYTELDFDQEIGRGAFGVVFKGRWRGGVVAIKQLLLKGSLSEKEVNEFKSEAAVMKKLRPHVNVVQFLGITSRPHLCIVTEFMEQGSLHGFIFSDAKIDANALMNIVRGISAGMLHLHQEGIVHRDLAARNVLLGHGFQVKIADFGLSRVTETNAAKSNQTKSDTGPLKWMAPESIQKRMYSTMSDVWSFGVTVWELVARDVPYANLDPVQTALEVTHSGLRLVIPTYTPPVLAEIMTECFKDVPEQRPNFRYICKRFQDARLDEWTPVFNH